MSHNNKKLAIVALVSLQSALMLAPGANPASWSRGPAGYQRFAPNRHLVTSSGENTGVTRTQASDIDMSDDVGQALVNHAKGHAVHSLAVAQEAADHAAAMQVVASHLAERQQSTQAQNEELSRAIVIVQQYLQSPNPTNGTLKAGYGEYKRAVGIIKARAHDSVKQAIGELRQAYAFLDMLPKNTVEAYTIDAELNMAINALNAVLPKI